MVRHDGDPEGRAERDDAALKWINYVQDPKVNAGITNAVFYPTANKAARQYVKPAIARDTSVYPPDEVLSKMTLLADAAGHSPAAEPVWAQLKTGR